MPSMQVTGTLEVSEAAMSEVERWMDEDILFSRMSAVLDWYFTIGARVENALSRTNIPVPEPTLSPSPPPSTEVQLTKVDLESNGEVSNVLARFKRSARN